MGNKLHNAFAPQRENNLALARARNRAPIAPFCASLSSFAEFLSLQGDSTGFGTSVAQWSTGMVKRADPILRDRAS